MTEDAMNYPTVIIIGATLLASAILSSNQKDLDAALSSGWTGIGVTERGWAWAVEIGTERMKVYKNVCQPNDGIVKHRV
tara:strand:+ start:607 stop:843 length:237 start_codon:yes stop_codon:yes gene_type:complete